MIGNAATMGRLTGVLLTLAVLVALPFFLWGDRLEQLFVGDGAIDWLAGYGSFAWLIAVGLLTADLVIPIPTTAIMSALGIIYGPFWGGLAAVGGSVFSGLVGYGLCRHLGRPFATRIAGEDALAQGERLFSRAGGWLVALSRWLPVLSEVMACIAGLARMPFAVFLGALLCGTVPLGFAFAAIGHLGANWPVLTLGIAAVLPVFLWFALRPIIRTRALTPDMPEGGSQPGKKAPH